MLVRSLYSWETIPSKRKMSKYCVIGKTLPHTLSPEIYNYFGIAYGVEELEEGELKGFVESKEYDGFNVTVPYKKAIMPLLDDIDDTALKIGAVNTVVLENGKYVGYNTDYNGMAYALDRVGISLKGKNVIILGTGGASMVAECLANNSGAKCVIKVGRSSEVNYTNVYELKDTEIIINTTPVGMSPNSRQSPIDLSRFPNLCGVYDAIYNPLETELIRQARALGIKADNGLAMLVEQARLARDYYTKGKSDIALTEKVLDKLYKKSLNLVLIGMPSCGKSTIAKELSERLNKCLVDFDEEFVRREKNSIESFFEMFGEREFRSKEKEICREFAGKLNQVISTGGGTVIDCENFTELARNGVIIYVDRPLDLLISDGRPLSKSKGVERLYYERKDIYEEADFKVINDRSIEEVVEEILEYEKNLSY